MDSSKVTQGLRPWFMESSRSESQRKKMQVFSLDGRLVRPYWLTEHYYLEHLVYRLLPSDFHDRCIGYGFNHVAPLVEGGRYGSHLSFFRLFQRQFQASDGDLADLPRTISPSLSGLLSFSKYTTFLSEYGIWITYLLLCGGMTDLPLYWPLWTLQEGLFE